MAGRQRTAAVFGSVVATSSALNSLAKGRLGYANLNTDVGAIDDSQNTLLVVNSVPIGSSRLTVVRAFVNISVDVDDSHSTVALSLWQGNTQIAGANYRLPVNANEQQGCWVQGDALGGSGDADFFFRVQRVHGSQTLTAQGSTSASGFLLIEDDGPNF